MDSPHVFSGQSKLRASPIVPAPASVAAALVGRAAPSAADVAAAVGTAPLPSITSLVVTNAVLDEGAVAALARVIATAPALEELSLKGSTTTATGWSTLLGGVIESATLRRVDLSECRLPAAAAEELAGTVFPWNRSVVQWCFAGNASLTEGGLADMARALAAAAHPVQDLCIAHCGIVRPATAAAIASELLALSELHRLDVAGNPAFVGLREVQALDTQLETNLRIAGLRGPHEALSTDLPPAEPPAAAAPTTSGRPSAADAPTGRGSGRAAGAPAPASGPGPVRRGASPTRGVRREPPAAGPKPSQVSRGQTPPRSSKGPDAGPAAEAKPALPKAATPTRRASPARGESPAAATGRSASTSSRPVSPARSGSAFQKNIDDGMDEWRANRDRYNSFIKDPAAKPTAPVQVRTYKYVLGKSVDKIKEQASRAFKPDSGVRDPYPWEIRKLAPWVTDPTLPRCPGRPYLVQDPSNPMCKIRFVDGGDLNVIDDDPRDIGHYARRVSNGQAGSSRTGGFASSTPREVRWGADALSQTPRHAQAPGPGAYTVKSEWEVRAEKLKHSTRPSFGSAPREAFVVKSQRDHNGNFTGIPGPGSYEIP